MLDPRWTDRLTPVHLAIALSAVVAGCGGPATEDPGAAASPIDVAVESLPSPAGPRSGEPNLFAAGDLIYLTWIEVAGQVGTDAQSGDPEDPTHALRFATWDGEIWSEPRTIAAGPGWFVNWADFPSLVVLPDGSLTAHWLVRTGPETYAYEVRIARSEDGGRSWEAPVVPHRDGSPTEHGFVSLFPAPDGGLGAVWLDGRKYAETAAGVDSATEGPPADAEMSLRAAVIGRSGEIGGEALLDGRVCDCCQTAAAMTSRGPVVVYRDRSAEEVRDVSIVRMVDGRWTDSRPLHEDGWVISACPVNGPAIAARDERVAVAWFTAARDTHRVWVAFSRDAGATFDPPVRIDEGAPLGRVDLELLGDGSVLVTWLEGSGAETRILARSVAPDGEIGRPLLVSPASAERASGFPRAAILGDRILFAWTDPGEPARVRVAVADRSG